MAEVWYWVVKPSEMGDTSRPSDARLVGVQTGSAEYKAFSSGQSYQGYEVYQGGTTGFTSQAQAQAAPPGGGSTLQQIAAGASAAAQQPGVLNQAAGGVAGAANAIQGVGNIDDLIKWLGQGAIWERVGEVLVGVIILYVGLKAVTTPSGQKPATRSFKDTATSIAKVAAK